MFFNGTLKRADPFEAAAAGISDLNNRRGVDLELAPRPTTIVLLH